MEAISLQAYAKINLGLDVLRKREDGYHEVRMIMQSISLADTLVLRKSSEEGIHLRNHDGIENPDVPMDSTNLVYRAIQMLKEEFQITEGIEAVLTKRIPVAAGMAGGSTDAAAALKGMNQLFSLGLSTQELCERGVKLGADIPYCIQGGTALSEGIGEILTPLPKMPDCYILIAKPPINVSTAFVYGNLKANELTKHPDIDGMIQAIHQQDLAGIADRLGNALETVTIPAYPVIADIKKIMVDCGAMQSLMSGSGPTVFGIFSDEKKAQATAEQIREKGLSEQVYVTKSL
ncbi:MAG: 4-(cytidine 5'-diphospho)-2-C-methyl-D-erythritol kinase [Lachnospiraceae bacterium]|nr:4-(cytidine 5'-diphospho)-2-C-methyl-D-erythritol kinase [Lachnospiraceae bacterium]